MASSTAFQADPTVTSLFADRGNLGTRRKRDILFLQGEKCRGVYLVLGGRVRLAMRSAMGQVQHESEVGPGALLGLPATFANEPYSLTAEVIEDAEVTLVSRESLLELMKGDLQLAVKLLETLGREVQAVRKAYARTA